MRPASRLTQSLLTRTLGAASSLTMLLMLVVVWAPLPWQTYSAALLAMRVVVMVWVIGLGSMLTWDVLRQRLRARGWIVASSIGLVLGALQALLFPDTVPGWPSVVANALPPLAYALLPLLLFASLRVSTQSAMRASITLALAVLGGLFLCMPFGMVLAGTSNGADVVDGSLLRPTLMGTVLMGAAVAVCLFRRHDDIPSAPRG